MQNKNNKVIMIGSEPWDAEACKKRLESVEWEWRGETHVILAEIFADTMERVHSFHKRPQTNRHTTFYQREQPAWLPTETDFATKVTVIMGDSIETGKALKDEGLRTAVLVMADRQGCLEEAKYGWFGQEKDILRRTDLFMHIAPYTEYAEEFGCLRSLDQYPLDRNFGGIYSPDVLVFRGRQKDGFPILDEPFTMDFISVAGMYNPDTRNGKIVPELVVGVKNKMRTIYRAALHNGNDALVLGAMGCGELGNPPYHTAQLFLEVLDEPEFKNQFRKVVFAMKGYMHYALFKLAVARKSSGMAPAELPADLPSRRERFQNEKEEEAHQNRDSEDWASAFFSGTKEAIEKYLREHPDGRHTGEARDRYLLLVYGEDSRQNDL